MRRALLLVVTVACGGGDAGAPPDAARPTADAALAVVDASPHAVDASPPDASPPDASLPDAPTPDAPTPDASPPDAPACVAGVACRLAFVASPAAGMAGPLAPSTAVAVHDGAGAVVPTDGIAVAIALGANPGGGSLTGTLTAATSAGVATFADLAIDRAGAGYTLAATAANLQPATSAPFTLAAWSPIGPEGGDVYAFAFHPQDPKIVYTSTNGGGVWRSDDGGGSWRRTGIPDEDTWALALDAAAPDTLYAGTAGVGSSVHRTTDGGATWTRSQLPLLGSNAVYQLAVDRNRVFAATSGGLARSGDSGKSWTLELFGTQIVYAVAIDATTPATLYAGTNGSGVWKSTDGGDRWDKTSTGFPETVTIWALAIDATDPRIVYAATAGQGVWKSTTSGAGWSSASSGLSSALHVLSFAIDPRDPGRLYAGTVSSGVYKSEDAGAKWAGTGWPFISNGINTVAVRADGVVFAGVDQGAGVSVSDDEGGEWRPSNTGLHGTFAHAVAISPADPQLLFAGVFDGFDGGLFRSTDGGASWVPTSITSIVTRALHAGGVLYVSSFGDGVHRSSNGGMSFEPRNTGLTSQAVNGLAFNPTAPATLYAATNGGGLFKTTNGGAMWAPINQGFGSVFANDIAVAPSSPATVYAAAFVGVYRSTSAGGAWSPTGPGLLGATTSLVVASADPDLVLCGTSSGLYRTTTGGTAWAASESGLPGSLAVETLAVHPTRPGVVYLGSLLHGAFVSTDFGLTWSPADLGIVEDTIADFAFSASDPDDLIAASRGHGVFRSTTGGR